MKKYRAVAVSLSPNEDRPGGSLIFCRKADYTFLDRDAGTVSLTPHGGETTTYKDVDCVLEAPTYRKLMDMVGRIHFCGSMLRD